METMTASYVNATTTNWPLIVGSSGTQDPMTYHQINQPTQITVSSRQEEIIMAKLIRYTVVDHDPTLVEEKPDACILLEGRVMLDGTDEKGFLMDLAPQVAEKLPAHNAMREAVEYEDEDGHTKKLKAIRLGQLDVVIEVLKTYAA